VNGIKKNNYAQQSIKTIMANCLTEVGLAKRSPQNFLNFALLFLN